MSTLGERIKIARKQKNLTQRQLANMIGVKHNSISDWENNKNKPDTDTIELLLGALDIDANTLLRWDMPEQLKTDVEALAHTIISNERIKKMIPLIASMSENDMDLLYNFISRFAKDGGKDGN